MKALTKAYYFLRLSRPRTWSFAITLFVFAYLSSGPVNLSHFALGVLVCSLVTAMTNALNIYTDQAEDRINLPERQEMLEAIGTRVFIGAVVGGYLLAVFVGVWVGVPFAIVALIGVIDSVFYSWGPRLKAHPLLALFAFSGAAVMPFLAGWVISRPLTAISPIIFVLGYSFFVYGNVKNIPDIRGDRSAGVRTLFTIFSYYKGIGLVAVLLTSPFLMLYAFILLDWLEPKYAVSFIFSPIIVYIVYRALVSQTREEREATHALGYFYQLVFFLVTLSAYYFSIYSVIAAVAILTFSVLMDYFKIDSRPYDLRLTRLLGIPGAFAKNQLGVLGPHRDLYLSFDQTLDLSELYQDVVERVGQLIECDLCALFVTDETTRELALTAGFGPPPGSLGRIRLKQGEGEIGHLTEGVRARNLPEIGGHLLAPDLPSMASAQMVSLLAKGSIVGVLAVASQRPRAFSDTDLEVLSALAPRAALAIFNARLLVETPDPLTGLFNGRAFYQYLRTEISAATRNGHPVSLLLLEMSGFKRLNEVLGDQLKNLALREVSKVLESCARETDLVARYGGEEFAVILPSTSSAEATIMADRIRSGIGLIRLEGLEIPLPTSIGVAAFPAEAATEEELIRVADQRVYDAKGSGRQRSSPNVEEKTGPS